MQTLSAGAILPLGMARGPSLSKQPLNKDLPCLGYPGSLLMQRGLLVYHSIRIPFTSAKGFGVQTGL